MADPHSIPCGCFHSLGGVEGGVLGNLTVRIGASMRVEFPGRGGSGSRRASCCMTCSQTDHGALSETEASLSIVIQWGWRGAPAPSNPRPGELPPAPPNTPSPSPSPVTEPRWREKLQRRCGCRRPSWPSGKVRHGRPVRAFSTSSPRPFRKRPMKPAYRASWMRRKTLTGESQSGTSNVSTSDPARLPDNLCEAQPARKTERFCPLEQLNMAKCAALSPVDCWRVSRKKTDAQMHDHGGGGDAPARCGRQTARS